MEECFLLAVGSQQLDLGRLLEWQRVPPGFAYLDLCISDGCRPQVRVSHAN